MKKNLLIYFIFFIILLLISLLSQLDLDGIWEYGFSYNIAGGLIPYRDYNMVVGPLYNLIFSIPIKLFGNHLYVFEIAHCLLFSLIFTIMYQKIKMSSIYIVLLFGLCFTFCGYNTFCVALILLILILLDSDYKYSDVLIGIIIGIILMTKHNIGVCLIILYLFKSKHKFLSSLVILIPVIPVITYLIINNAFYEYIDYCYLGLGSFIDNMYIDILSLFPFIISIFILFKQLYQYLKSDRKDIKILYVACFYVFVFPILDQGHVVPVIIPLVYYLLTKNYQGKMMFFIKYFIIIGYIMTTIVMVMKSNLYIDNNYLKYQIIPKNVSKYLKGYDDYLSNVENNYKVYLIVENSYMIKLYRNQYPNVYDLLNDGNLGSNPSKYIRNMKNDCKDKKCVFILDNRYFKKKRYFQYSRNFKKFVVNNYEYLKTLPSGDKVYINNK